MVNKFAATGSGCACAAWLFVILACGLPLFMGTTTNLGEGMLADTGINGTGKILVGAGIWGAGFWLDGDVCENAKLLTDILKTRADDDSCYQYKMWTEYKEEMDDEAGSLCKQDAFKNVPPCNPAWITGAQAASVLTCILLLVVVALGFAGKIIPAVLLSFLCMILTIVPFALWETEMQCNTDEGGVENCDRFVSYGFQVFAFVLILFSISGFVIARIKGDDSDSVKK